MNPHPTSDNGFPEPHAPSGIGSTDWPLRAWGLAFLGAMIGLAVHLLTTGHPMYHGGNEADLRTSAAIFACVAGFMFGVLVERSRILWSVGFAILSGAIVGFASYWNAPSTWSNQEEPWWLGCALLCIAIAAPLFQAWRRHYHGQADRWHIPYPATHQYAWNNVVLWFAAWSFVGITWLMAFLLAALFELIGIDALNDLLAKDWMALVLSGAALGAGVALLRDREHILGLLQRVFTTILSVLAPVLAVGLVTFILALPFTGLTPLWEATKSTTPILLICIIGALSLINATIGDTDEQASKSRILRISAIALSLAILPLALIAVVSTGSRIHQYGLTPERIWAVIFTAIACAYGVAYLVSIVRGRLQSTQHIRRANLRLAIGLCVLAFVLSTPPINFSAISAANQLSRLQNGTTPADQFDWVALRFDTGKAGLETTRMLAKKGSTPQIRAAAAEALKATDRWELNARKSEQAEKPIDEKRLNILPKTVALPPELRRQLQLIDACSYSGPCTIIYEEGSAEAITVQGANVNLWQQVGDTWKVAEGSHPYPDSEQMKAVEQALAAGKYEIREVTNRQLFVNGQPVGNLFK